MSPKRRAVDIAACDVAGCAQPIIWTRTVKGNVMPVDADPSPAGNILLDTTHRDPDGRPYAGVLSPGQRNAAHAAGAELRTHHALSCTHPEQWHRGDATRARQR